MPRKDLLLKQCPVCEKSFETKHLHQKTCSIKCGTTLMRRMELRTNEEAGISQAWACGGGVQSTAIAALIYTGKLPKPDHAWIVDVGYEKSKTFDYVQAVLTPKLREIGVMLHIIKTTDHVDNGLFDKQENCVLPLFAKGDDGIVRKYNTHCSGTWKQRVAHQWLRSMDVKRCDTWIGISIDEKRRIKRSRLQWNQNRYPLVEMGIRREDCIDLIARMGWPKPEHTSCYLCPNQSDFQWQDIKRHYQYDWSKALAAEEYIRSINSTLYLHRTCKPLKDIGFDIQWSGPFVGKECFGDCEPGIG